MGRLFWRIDPLLGFLTGIRLVRPGNKPDELVGTGSTVVLFGTWGDLIESLLKRTLGVKDSGNVLPGHGGMLDRFDSVMLAVPASYIYIELFIRN